MKLIDLLSEIKIITPIGMIIRYTNMILDYMRRSPDDSHFNNIIWLFKDYYKDSGLNLLFYLSLNFQFNEEALILRLKGLDENKIKNLATGLKSIIDSYRL